MALTPSEFEALLQVAKRHRVAAFEVLPTPSGPGLKVSFNPLAFMPEDAPAPKPGPAQKKAAEKRAQEALDEELFHSSTP